MNSKRSFACLSLAWIAAALALLGPGRALAFTSHQKKGSSRPAAGLAASSSVSSVAAKGGEARLTTPNAAALERWCKEVSTEIEKVGWKGLDPCTGIGWEIGGWSLKGRPLVYAEFGSKSSANTTLILSTIHGDEVTPLYLGIELLSWMKRNPESLKESRVVVAPLVNPDGFFAHPRRRTNARGVDVNRNFPTQDWERDALRAWKTKFRSNPRRYPGSKPSSEPETIFQQELISRVRPQKVLAIHAPLNFMDYDGPSHLTLARFPEEYVRECMKLRERLRAVPGGFFPGSLGNFAGQEMGIPTLTLELPSANPRKAEEYWKSFSRGIRNMIDFTIPASALVRNAKPPSS